MGYHKGIFWDLYCFSYTWITCPRPLNLFLYAEDFCLGFQGKYVIDIEKQINTDHANICECFVDNRLSIHFGKDKTISILLVSKYKVRNVPKRRFTYLGCILDETMSGESMALKVINKMNLIPKFLHRKNKNLTQALCRLLFNSHIQPHFDYASSAWYPILTQKMKSKIQITQSKCIGYSPQLDKIINFSKNEFQTLNWLPVKNIQSIHKFNCFQIFHWTMPQLSGQSFFELAFPNNLRTLNRYLKLIYPFRKTWGKMQSLSLVPQFGIKPQMFSKKAQQH